MLNYLRYQASSSVQSLQGVSTSTIVTQLGQVAEGINSLFTCGGKYKVPSNEPIKLAYRPAGVAASSEEWCSVEFPGVSEAAMIKLLDVCSVASYGYEGKDVVDKNYRNAFKLDPNNFLTSFQMCSIPILQEIQSIVPTVVGLKAQLYKLNIYARGGFFKAHVDTPRSEKMFGSLVVCLPTQFTGGELIVRHHKEEIKYDWSSIASDTSSTLHWAAFFSDVEHEVLPVSEGYRVTLTYNLSYQSEASDSTFDVKTCGFYKLLQAALSNPVFMRDGGVLGFNSHYSYVFDTQWSDLLAHINTIEDKGDTIRQLNEKVLSDKFVHLSKDEQVEVLKCAGIEDVTCNKILGALPSGFPLLKGADYIVVESARSLQLPICVKPFLDHDAADGVFKYGLKDFSHVFPVGDEMESDFEHQLESLQLFGDAVCRCKSQDITWCQELVYHQPAGAALHYGNEATVDLWYKSAAILIRIPKWNNYRQKLIAISTGEYCGEPSAADDGVVKDFKDVIHNYDEISQEEIQQLVVTLEELLANEYISKEERLTDKQKELQMMLSTCAERSGWRADDIIFVKQNVLRLKNIIDSERPFFYLSDLMDRLIEYMDRLKKHLSN